MALEWLARGAAKDPVVYPFEMELATPRIIDTRPLIRGIAEDIRRQTDGAIVARRFHATIAEMIDAVCRELRSDCGLSRVVLSGGVFMNALLTTMAAQRLQDDGFSVYCHCRVPANDGGLCLGQLAVAASALE